MSETELMCQNKGESGFGESRPLPNGHLSNEFSPVAGSIKKAKHFIVFMIVRTVYRGIVIILSTY